MMMTQRVHSIEYYDLSLADVRDGQAPDDSLAATLRFQGNTSLLNAAPVRTSVPFEIVPPSRSSENMQTRLPLPPLPALPPVVPQQQPQRIPQQQQRHDNGSSTEASFGAMTMEELQLELARRKRLLYLKQKRDEKIQNLTQMRVRDIQRRMTIETDNSNHGTLNGAATVNSRKKKKRSKSGSTRAGGQSGSGRGTGSGRVSSATKGKSGSRRNRNRKVKSGSRRQGSFRQNAIST